MNKNHIGDLPAKFTRNISNLHGAEGEKWLADLPRITEEVCGRWSLRIKRVFPNLSFNFVAACANGRGEQFVLKIGVPEEDAPVIYEKRALEAFGGNGAVKLINFDAELTAMLIEKAVEGATLSEVCGEDFGKAVEIAVDVMRKLPRQPPNKSDFINLESWIDGLNRAANVGFEPEKVCQAQKFFGELCKPFENKILLHGDIHFDNILSAKREPFLLIDPKGIVGEIGYEIAVFLNDLAGWTSHLVNQKEVLNSAIESFSRAFSVGAEDLRKWSYSFAVLSAWWMLEDFGVNRKEDVLRAEIWEV